jgi:hypothetical protein
VVDTNNVNQTPVVQGVIPQLIREQQIGNVFRENEFSTPEIRLNYLK